MYKQFKFAYLMLFIAACLWGISIPIMKALGTEQIILAPEGGSLAGSAASLCARFGLAAMIVLAWSRKSPLRIRRAEWKHGVILGAFTAVSMFLQVDGLAYTDASTSGFLIAMYSVLIPVITWMTGKSKMTWVLFTCCLLVLAGMATLTRFSPSNFSLGRGEWESLAAACLFAGQIIWVNRVPPDEVDPNLLTFVLCASVSVFCLCALIFLPGGLPIFLTAHSSERAIWLTLFLAILGTTLPFMLMNRFQNPVGPVAAGFIYCSEPLVAALGAFVLPELLVRNPALYANEALTPHLVIGGAFILSANLLLLRNRS